MKTSTNLLQVKLVKHLGAIKYLLNGQKADDGWIAFVMQNTKYAPFNNFPKSHFALLNPQFWGRVPSTHCVGFVF